MARTILNSSFWSSPACYIRLSLCSLSSFHSFFLFCFLQQLYTLSSVIFLFFRALSINTMPQWTIALMVGLALLVPGIVANSPDAQSAMSAFLSINPISTRSASAAKPTNVTAAVLAGKYTPSRSWDFSRDVCPGSCESLGVNGSSWPVYPGMHKLSHCDDTMLLRFSL